MGKRAIRFYESCREQAIYNTGVFIDTSDVDFLQKALHSLEKIAKIDWIIRKETNAVKGTSLLDDWMKLERAAKKLSEIYQLQMMLPVESELKMQQLNDHVFSRYNKNLRSRFEKLLNNNVRNKRQLEYLLESLESKPVAKRLLRQLKIAGTNLKENYSSDDWVEASSRIKRSMYLAAMLSPNYFVKINENYNLLELDTLVELIEKWQQTQILQQWIRSINPPDNGGSLNFQVQLEKDSLNDEMEIRAIRNRIYKSPLN